MEVFIVSSNPYSDGPSFTRHLEDGINKHIKKGFRLHGSPYAVDTKLGVIHYQAMIKQDRDRLRD